MKRIHFFSIFAGKNQYTVLLSHLVNGEPPKQWKKV